MQWAELTPGLVLVAVDDRAWLHRPPPGGIGDAFSERMSGNGAVRSTRKLLDGALEAGRQSVASMAFLPLTPARWAWRLACQYHTTHVTPALLSEARDRFSAMGRRDLVEYCARQMEEEQGHDELALSDLRALGYRAEALVAKVMQPTACAVTDYFAECVRSAHPVRSLGYSYALERAAMAVSRDYVEAVEAVLPGGVKATRCLRVHSAIGSDPKHIAEAVEFIAGLSAEERIQIARACFFTSRIMSTVRDGDDPVEEVIVDVLSSLKLFH